VFGKLFHSLLAKRLKGEEIEIPRDSRFLDPDLKQKQLKTLIERLEFPNISISAFQSEVSFTTSQLFGILDGIINNEIGFELKVSANMDGLPLWLEQIKFYFLISDLPRFLLFWAKQPGRKEDFKPKFEWRFYKREEMELNEGDFLITKKLVDYFSSQGFFPKNPVFCPCEYRSLCEGGDISADEFKIREGGV
jgi:hypothetical protein